MFYKSLMFYKKEILSLAYLFFVGVSFGAIWIFYDSHGSGVNKDTQILTIEENHRNSDVIEATAKPVETFEIIEVAWQVNAVRVASFVDDKPLISIVIDDLGIVKKKTFDVMKLDAPLTLSFLPYAPDLRDMTQYARGRGHELMVHLPMEPKGDKDPGPHAMRTDASDDKMREDLYFNLSQFEGYVGLNNHMGSAFTEDARGLDLILAEVQKKGLLVLDSRTSQNSLFAKMATDRDIPNVTRDFFLDNVQDVDYILGQLAKLEQMARRRGNAIAIGHPYRQTIEALSVWLPTMKAKGIAVVPLSHLIKRKYEKIQRVARNVPSGGQAASSQ